MQFFFVSPEIQYKSQNLDVYFAANGNASKIVTLFIEMRGDSTA